MDKFIIRIGTSELHVIPSEEEGYPEALARAAGDFQRHAMSMAPSADVAFLNVAPRIGRFIAERIG